MCKCSMYVEKNLIFFDILENMTIFSNPVLGNTVITSYVGPNQFHFRLLSCSSTGSLPVYLQELQLCVTV